jgi:sporulation protein YlmC with PRC-barrel domain
MQIVFGAHVRTSDDQEVGTVDRLVLDPESGGLKSVAIRRGRILHHDIEVPVASFVSDEGGVLRLNVTAAEVAAFPEFCESMYTAKGDSLAPMHYSSGLDTTFSDPQYGAAISDLAATTVESSAEWGVFLTEENLQNAVIRDGSDVRDPAGHRLGAIHELTFDTAARRLAQFTLRRGMLRHESVTLPASLVTAIDDGVVTLSVSGEWLEGWAGVETGMEVWTEDAVLLGVVSARDVDGIAVTGSDGSRYRVPAAMIVERMDSAITLDVSRDRADALIVPA